MASSPSPVYFGSPKLDLKWFLPENIHLPDHWIGVRFNWEHPSSSPWSQLVSLTPEQMATHSLLIGSTGSGKTNLIHHLLMQDIRRGHSIVLLDLRGDLVSAALELCAVARLDPHQIKLLDLRDSGVSFGFDPLYGAGEPYFRALGVLDAVAEESDSWGVQLSETLRNALLLLAETGEPLTRLEDLMYDRAFRMRLLERCDTDQVLNFWNRFGEMSSERQNSLVMPVLNKVSLLLATKTLRGILGHQNPIELGKHLNKRGSVTLVSLAVDELHSAGRMMGKLILASICREIFARVRIPEDRRNPVRLYVDEFEHFGAHDFETILAEGRRFKLSVVLAHQTLAQLSTKLRSMILNNVGVKVVFRCGREDGAYLSKDLTGDPSALRIPDLAVGDAYIWRRGIGVQGVEINEPIVRRDSPYASYVRAYLDELCELNQAEPSRPKPDHSIRDESLDIPSDLRIGNLGDWLCD